MKIAHARLGFSIALLVGGPLAAFSCADAIHLDLPPGEGGTQSNAGGGGSAPSCSSNSDCPTPTSVCDTTKDICVECLLLSDCAAKPGTVCSEGACVCPTAGESWCTPASCVDLQSSPQNCGSCGHACFGACNQGACADPWEPTAQLGAPSARYGHVAVWTGTEMVVWGGYGGAGYTNSGGIYNPATHEWRATSIVNAPTPRESATAVWTGTRMIVWGGVTSGTPLADGAMLDPATNTWETVETTSQPSPRYRNSALWTGTQMVVWGGYNGIDPLNTGGRFDPVANAWTNMSSPATPRYGHSAVWTGTNMLIYGGVGLVLGSPTVLPGGGEAGGFSYAPSSDTWTSLTPTNEPGPRYDHTAVIAGQTMVVWGGYDGSTPLSSGAQYSTVSSSWTSTNPPAPAARYDHTALWLDGANTMMMWGGVDTNGTPLATGAIYDPTLNAWNSTPTALPGRYRHTMVSMGDAVLIWGGIGTNGSPLADGGVYTP